MSTPPTTRARKFLFWLAKRPEWFVVFHGRIVLADEAEEELARVIEDALGELREGFLRKPRKDPTTNG